MYQNFIGIDISKNDFAVALHLAKETKIFPNNLQGFEAFVEYYSNVLNSALCVLETTGGYELNLLRYLRSRKIAIHRANTRKVKYFIRSFGVLGKSDAIDAKGLAKYGAERSLSLEIFNENPRKILQKLVERRRDITQMLVQEKNRLQAPDQEELKESFAAIIRVLEEQKKIISDEIEAYCKLYSFLNKSRKIIETVDGIGKVISAELIALLPELGQINRKKIASLAGVAPHPYESGNKVGYRPTRGGRERVKSILFMAALTASRSMSKLGDFYRNLVNKGKKKMVALVALMRKILIVANARLKEFYNSNLAMQHG